MLIRNTKSAFTLVEILLVVAIIGMIAALAAPNILKARILTCDALAKKTLKSIETALAEYAVAGGNYPSSTSELITPTPPYLNKDYFTGTHVGFAYSYVLDSASGYTLTATPDVVGTSGSTTFTLTAGGIITP